MFGLWRHRSHPESPTRGPRLALLIDADNATPSHIGPVLAEVAKLGRVSLRRIYGDWTQPALGGWKAVLHRHAIRPVQQFRYTTGKNATDAAMIVDAMDLLHSRRFDGFALVSSDSDFTGLAHRLREDGLVVYGFGTRLAPEAFVRACDRFFHLDATTVALATPRAPAGALAVAELLLAAYDDLAPDGGWVPLERLGPPLHRRRPGFSARAHGHGRLSRLVTATGLFDVEHRPGPGGAGPTRCLVRRRVPARPAASRAGGDCPTQAGEAGALSARRSE